MGAAEWRLAVRGRCRAPDRAVDKQEGAQGIFRSLNGLLKLPPETELWPGHPGGSLCGGPGMDLKNSSTLAYERAHNEMLREKDEDALVKHAIEGLGPQPPDFQAIVEMNKGQLVTEGVEVRPLTPRQLEQKRKAGALAPTCGPISSLMMLTSRGLCAFRRYRRALGHGWHGWLTATRKSCSWVVTTRTRVARPSSRCRSGS